MSHAGLISRTEPRRCIQLQVRREKSFTSRHDPLHFLAFDRIGLCVFGTILGCRRIFVVVNSRLPSKGTGTAPALVVRLLLDCVLLCKLSQIPRYLESLVRTKIEQTVDGQKPNFRFWASSLSTRCVLVVVLEMLSVALHCIHVRCKAVLWRT